MCENVLSLKSIQIFVCQFSVIFSLIQAGDVKPQEEHYLPDYNIYHNLSKIQAHLVDMVNKHPEYISIDWTYQSKENRPQMLVKITNLTEDRLKHFAPGNIGAVTKVRILFSYGEHAREFLPVESMIYLLLNISSGISSHPNSAAGRFARSILSNVELYIVPMMNPDGRIYLENTGNYCWRGTSTGTDLNRNFDWNYGAAGSSNNPADEEYRGKHPFSEPECRVLKEITTQYQFDAFVSFHSGIREIYIPFSDSISRQLKRKPENSEAMLVLADVLARAAIRTFKYEFAFNLNEYSADGTIFDYMAGEKKIPFSYAIELYGEGNREDAKCFDLFNPPSKELQFELECIHPMYEALFAYFIDWKQRQMHIVQAPSHGFGIALVMIMVALALVMGMHIRRSICLRVRLNRRIFSLTSLNSVFSLLPRIKF